jgi:Double-GTPase 2
MIDYLLTNGYLVAGQLGLFFGVALFLVALGQGLWKKPELLTPQEYQAEQIKAHPVGVGQFEPDLAWPFYTIRQAGIDRRVVKAHLRTLYRRMWKWPADTFFRGRHGSRLFWWFLLPIPVSVIIFLLTGGLSAWFFYWVYWLVSNACVIVSHMVSFPVQWWLRSVEAQRRKTRWTQASCMECFHVTPWPAYQCPGCSRLHHDIRPGMLGLLTRRCECGAHLPTLASRAGWRLTAVCKRCNRPLPKGTGAVRDLRIPIFGDKSAGKTRFLYASLNSLVLTAQEAGLAIDYPDQESQDQAGLGLDIIHSGQDTAKTSATARAALSFRLGDGHKSSLIHLFDAAGEQYRDAQGYESLRFLDHGQGLVYVLDPFSIGTIRDQLTGHNAAAIRLAHAAAGDPEIAYGEVASRLRDSGVPASDQRLAVVISKIDMLRGTGLGVPAESDAIAEWLLRVGLHNLVLSAQREFAEVRYFTVASQDVTADRGDDPGVPLRWLLTAHGVRLPADQAAAPRQARPATSETAGAAP